MKDRVVYPKFLTLTVAEMAVKSAMLAVLQPTSPIGELLKRQAFHIVILVPAMKDDRDNNYPDWPDYPLQPFMLYERSVGTDWSNKYDEIARCKALQLWHDRNDDRMGIIPHLLFPGDTPYCGGVKRHGIVVACSGVQEHFDKMISGIVADTLVGLAYDAWEKSDDKKNGVTWLT